MKYATLGSIALATLLVSGFSGCGSDGDTTNTTSTTPSLTGYYLDSAVVGVDYNTSGGYQGYTGNDGSFKFNTGESVTLRLGELTLRNISSANLANGKKIIENDDAVITFLQSIDEDGDPTNGISVTSQTRTAVQEWATENSITSLEVNATHLIGANELQTKLQANDLNQTQIKTIEEARTHLAATLAAEPDAKILYTDYKGETREALSSAAAAEYHTGTGYGHTLFDSADNKCQNCHNELYDTWKGSMHGKSWTDPIFQSKFQDFLRTHIAKLNTNPTGTKEYTETVFKGAAQTCIKCHAPAAYYAGDVEVTLTQIADATNISSTELAALKVEHEASDPSGQISVIAANSVVNKVYKATFQIGHAANREGINCAFCHSMETPRMMGLTQDPDSYTLKNDIRVGPVGGIKAAAGTTLNYNVDATDPDMNKFFRLWGPEKYSNTAATPKNVNDYDVGKSADGRYTMASKDLNGTDGKVHYTGGPFYGPFGVTGLRNENSTDETNRTAQVHPDFNYATNNHFGNNGKALCLSCHQRSAGAAVPSGEDGAGQFMELCSTWNAVTTGTDNNVDDTMSSPKCQKCHMERIEGTVLHQWASPDKLFTDKTLLTSHFYADDSEGFGTDNPVASGWLNSHAFLGASKTGGDKAAAVAKIKSGFDATLTTSNDGTTLTVTATITNKTAHMFPGAHPMRRTLSRIIVTDENGTMLPVVSATGTSTFGDITNSVATLTGKTLHSSAASSVSVNLNGSDTLDFPGKVADLNGSAVSSQKFTAQTVTITGTDATLTNQTISNGVTSGDVFNAAIIDSSDTTNFTRIYGHETGKKYDLDNNTSTDSVFVVRPGFDSNMVANDTRLSPNETETYTLTYDISGKAGISTTYKVYYMQKGANGKFLTGADGWLDQALSDSKKLLVTEVFSDTVTE
ncbi:multiheme c-type cytochrome [Sulfurimonas marina]|uniref:Cytochrome c-552/4 domain-containing protein n=1 Tax=Sulfurimonas marina TaxID=2590551 RepID=A0A7M1AWZ9_9BACT|nr:multiheme c-type cytochrome [Sulfurimonas marina]QOP41987.1 hypothetical protein FJR03_09655 [Sulfurimonas marina]